MNRNTTSGAILLGLGLGILLGRLIPDSAWLWPFGLILGGLLLWRLGWGLTPLTVAAASLALALTGSPLGFAGFGARAATRFESSDAQEAAWDELARVVVLNSVGDLEIEEEGDLEIGVSYRRSRGGAPAPTELQASYDEASRTLTLIGVDPHSSEDERRGLEADLELEIPAGVRVEASTEVGSVALKGGLGAVLESDVGDLEVKDTRGEVVARTRVGNVELSFDDAPQAPIRAEAEVGDVRLTLPEDADATVRAVSGLRNFGGELERVAGDEGRLSLGGGLHEVELRTDVGKVEVRTR